MWQIFIGSLILSIIHATIPNHWIPLIVIGRTERWTKGETLIATTITGFAHALSTVFVGILVGLIGYKLSKSHELISSVVSPAILVFIGIIYLMIDIRKSHHHVHFDLTQKDKSSKSKWTIIVSLSISMFLTPCAEIEAYYFQAGTIGWIGIIIVSAVYVSTTIVMMLGLVYLGIRGIKRFDFHYLEHHDKQMTGIVLILLGILAYFS